MRRAKSYRELGTRVAHGDRHAHQRARLALAVRALDLPDPRRPPAVARRADAGDGIAGEDRAQEARLVREARHELALARADRGAVRGHRLGHRGIDAPVDEPERLEVALVDLHARAHLVRRGALVLESIEAVEAGNRSV